MHNSTHTNGTHTHTHTDEEAFETSSVHSTDSDDFVVIIPDCFDVNKPLSGYTPPVIESEYPAPPPIIPHDIMTRSSDSHMTSSVKHEPEPQVKHKPIPTPSQPPTLTSSTPPQGATPPTARREFVPQRVTIKNVQDARRLYKRPLTLATGLVNAMSDLVSEKVTFAPSGKKATDVGVVNTREEESSSSDEEFEVNYYIRTSEADNGLEVCTQYTFTY